MLSLSLAAAVAAVVANAAPANELYPELNGFNPAGHAAGLPDPLTSFTWDPATVDVSAMHPALVPLFAPQVQDYLISVINLDPVEELNRANTDTLILQGKTDLQVTVEDARLLDRARKTKMRLVDDMNHVLKEAPADRAANLATYADPSLPLAPRLVGRIEDFVKDND